MVFDTSSFQIIANILLVELVDGQSGQEGLRLCQLFLVVAWVSLVESQVPQFIRLYTIFIEFVEDEGKDFLGGVLAAQEDRPQALCNHMYLGRVWLQGGKSDDIPDGCIKMFLKIMVRACFELFTYGITFLVRLTLGVCFFPMLGGSWSHWALFLFWLSVD